MYTADADDCNDKELFQINVTTQIRCDMTKITILYMKLTEEMTLEAIQTKRRDKKLSKTRTRATQDWHQPDENATTSFPGSSLRTWERGCDKHAWSPAEQVAGRSSCGLNSHRTTNPCKNSEKIKIRPTVFFFRLYFRRQLSKGPQMKMLQVYAGSVKDLISQKYK